MSDQQDGQLNPERGAYEQSTGHGDPFDYDAELRRYNEHFRIAAGIRPHDRVLDVGCGAGQSTRDAARVAVAGRVLGVDVSSPMLERARRLGDNEGLRNVTYLQADAGDHRFRPAHFDVCISRFGTMFFPDPVAAFTNLGRALRPSARLVLLVWQDRDRNEWSSAIAHALTGSAIPIRAAKDRDPFSLADPATTKAILTKAGFTDMNFADVHEPVYYGPDSAAAYAAVLKLYEPNDSPAASDPDARRRLRATIAGHDTGSGVHFDSRAWIVTASRAVLASDGPTHETPTDPDAESAETKA